MPLGIYEPKLDDRGRMFLPVKSREDTEGGIILTWGQEYRVYAFPASQLEEMTEDLMNAPLSLKQTRDRIRVMLSDAYKEVPDKQGRTSIPADLRTYTSLDCELTIIGAGLRTEIWNAKAWRECLIVQKEVSS